MPRCGPLDGGTPTPLGLNDLAVPGDNSTGLERDTVRLRVFDPDGTVLIQAGRTVLARDDDRIVFQAGPHQFDEYFGQRDPTSLQPLCGALA